MSTKRRGGLPPANLALKFASGGGLTIESLVVNELKSCWAGMAE